MIRPVPRSIMCSSAARDMKKAPDRLTARTLYQSSSVILEIVLSDGDAGVVDEDVQAPVMVDDLLHGAPAVLGRADVALVDGDRDLVLGELGLEGLGALAVAAVAGGDRGALRGQAVADRGADAARAAGDHGHAALELLADGRERLGFGVGAGHLVSLLLAMASERSREPLGDVGPDLLAGLRAGHQADVPAGAIEVGDVGA